MSNSLCDQRKVRVLHVVGGLSRGGIETWLMHVLRNIDRDRFQLDFLVHTAEPQAYDDEARTLGSAILSNPHTGQPWHYAATFRELMRTHGAYDVIHSHVHSFSGFIMLLAEQAGIPVRIVHSHLDTAAVDAASSPQRKAYLRLMHHLIDQHATAGFAVSEKAARSLFGQQWQHGRHYELVYCSIALHAFAAPTERAAVRAELGIPADAQVIGHVGRFAAQKNHHFLVAVLQELAPRHPNLWLLLVGEGDLRPAIEEQVQAAGLADRVVFTGSRPDVPRLMQGAMDVFVLPSTHEGLPIVGIEAQAAGLPFVVSDVVTEEGDIIAPLVFRQSLTSGAAAWAATIEQALGLAHGIDRPAALRRVLVSPFNIDVGVRTLEEAYCERLQLTTA